MKVAIVHKHHHPFQGKKGTKVLLSDEGRIPLSSLLSVLDLRLEGEPRPSVFLCLTPEDNDGDPALMGFDHTTGLSVHTFAHNSVLVVRSSLPEDSGGGAEEESSSSSSRTEAMGADEEAAATVLLPAVFSSKTADRTMNEETVLFGKAANAIPAAPSPSKKRTHGERQQQQQAQPPPPPAATVPLTMGTVDLDPPETDDLGPLAANELRAVQWSWKHKDRYEPFALEHTKAIEANYRLGNGRFEVLIRGEVYLVDLEAWTQAKKSDPSKTRRIRREIVTRFKLKCLSCEKPYTRVKLGDDDIALDDLCSECL
jgi:hypothetical protein